MSARRRAPCARRSGRASPRAARQSACAGHAPTVLRVESSSGARTSLESLFIGHGLAGRDARARRFASANEAELDGRARVSAGDGRTLVFRARLRRCPAGPALRGHRRRARDGAVLARAHPAVDRVAHLPHDRRRAAHQKKVRGVPRLGLVGGGRRVRRARRRARRPSSRSRAGDARFVFQSAGSARAGSERAQVSRGVAYGLRFLGLRRAGTALGLALDNASLPMIGCAVFFFTPTFLTLYGCATGCAGAARGGVPGRAGDEEPRGRHAAHRARALEADMRAVAVLARVQHAVVAGARAQRGARGSRSGATSSWRSCSGWRCSGARTRVTARRVRGEGGIVSEHHKAAARARVAKEAARLERRLGAATRSAAPGASPRRRRRRDESADELGERRGTARAADGPRGRSGGRGAEPGGVRGRGVPQENLRRRVNAAAGSRE